MERNKSFENSLRCLQHPISLLCIALLLLNDHVFKVISPSWLTGKLSDFAGLFFFPFIVAAGLSFGFSKFGLSSRQLGQISFGIVAIWFVLLKTFPPINYLTIQFSSLLIGSPTRFVLDASDIIGLMTLIPAWKIWNQHQEQKPSKFAYVILSFGAIAAIATSPQYPTVYSVTNLEYYKDGIVYAADRENYGELYPQTAVSNDGGSTWQEANIESVEMKSLPIIHCSHLDPNNCFQVTKRGSLEQSKDKGSTWTAITASTHDLILFEWDGKEYVIVAIGERGVFRQELPDGEWIKISVLSANK